VILKALEVDVRPNRETEVRTPDDDATASEIAAFAYCAKAWHLERVIGAPASAASARLRHAGTTHHARHGGGVQLGSWLSRYSRLAVLALLVLAGALAVLAMLIR
jgi:hypothetical protein